MKLSARLARLEQRISSESQLSLRSMTYDELTAMLLEISRDTPTDDSLPPDEHERATDQARS